MAISTFDQYVASNKQLISVYKVISITTVGNSRFSTYQITGDPGAGSLTSSNTTSGALVTSSTTGFHSIITSPTPSASYYISRATFNSTVVGAYILQDLIYKAGTYAYNVSQTLSSQPSIASRIPIGSDYSCIDMYFECVTSFTGATVVTVTYTNQDGVAGRSYTTAIGTPIVGKHNRLPLQAGDTGVQKIESVTCTGATAGTFNIILVRDLLMARVVQANGVTSFGIDGTGMPEIFQTSALHIVSQVDGTASGAYVGYLEIASG